MSVKYHGIDKNKILNNAKGKTKNKCSGIVAFSMFAVMLLVCTYLLMCSVYHQSVGHLRSIVDKHYVINFDNIDEKTVFSVFKFNRTIYQVHLNDEFGQNFSIKQIENGLDVHGVGQDIKFETVQNSDNFTLIKVSRTLDGAQVVSDCFDLFSEKLHWYGGTESVEDWPIDKSQYEYFAYLATTGVAERYWLHSQGGFIYVDDQAPLFVNQNVMHNRICFKVENTLPYNVRREKFNFIYYLGMAVDAKQAQMKAVEIFLNKPKSIVDRRMIEHPIWSTWARYKKDVNESIILNFAKEIQNNGFNNSQIEIDDYWESCYGSMTFDTNKFPNISNLVSSLKTQGFRVTLWSHPFINKGCEPWYSEAKSKGFVLKLFSSLSVVFDNSSI